MLDNNDSLKAIKAILRLSEGDIKDIVYLGGVDVSKSLAKAWTVSVDSLKGPTGNTGATRRAKFRKMSDDEYSAFFHGLRIWLVEEDLRARFQA